MVPLVELELRALGVNRSRMRILVDIGHPGHVHLFKHFVWKMEKKGHEFLITAKDKEVSLRLLDAYGVKYVRTGSYPRGLVLKGIYMLRIDWSTYRVARHFKPDLLISMGSPNAAHVSWLLRKPHIAFDDTEHSGGQYYLYAPFTKTICTPSCFLRNLGAKQVRYAGYHELAYLHPNYYSPDPSVLGKVGLSPEDKFIVVRFVSWSASHDVGQQGVVDPGHLVMELEKYGRVLITSERKLPTELERYRITVAPEKLHDLLYYATLYVGEGATMASECAALGTPAIYVNTLSAGTLKEQEEKYGLIYCFSDPQTGQSQALAKAVELLQRPHLREEWRGKRGRLLADKTDVTQFMVDFIEDYPESFRKYRMEE